VEGTAPQVLGGDLVVEDAAIPSPSHPGAASVLVGGLPGTIEAEPLPKTDGERPATARPLHTATVLPPDDAATDLQEGDAAALGGRRASASAPTVLAPPRGGGDKAAGGRGNNRVGPRQPSEEEPAEGNGGVGWVQAEAFPAPAVPANLT